MTTTVANPSTVLGWVREDLDKHVDHLRLQVEHLAGLPNIGAEAMQDAVTRLEDLEATFHVLMLSGAARLVAEMVDVCKLLAGQKIYNRDVAFSAMMDAVVVLPSYLDRLQAGHQDLPLLLLPSVNNLRRSHHAALLQESAIFTPRLDVDVPELELEGDDPDDAQTLTEIATRLREQYENALLNWQQDQQSDDLLAPLQGVCETMMRRAGRTDLKRLWWVASETVGAATEGFTDNDAELRRLFARLHLVLKKLSEGGEDAVDEASVEGLTRAYLHRVSQSKRGNPGLEHLRKSFELESLIADQEQLVRARGAVSGQNRDMYLSLGAAVQDELDLVKDALDLELRTQTVDAERRAQSVEALARLQDTLNMLALSGPAQALDELMPTFLESEHADAESREPSLMQLAEQLLLVESALKEQIETLGDPPTVDQDRGYIDLPAHEQRQIRCHVLDEAINSIYQFQEAVKTRFGGQKDIDLETPLDEVASVLELLEDAEGAALTRRLKTVAVELLEHAHSESSVPARSLEIFTDAVAALELYLAACRDHQADSLRFASILKQRVEALESGESLTAPAEIEASEPQLHEAAIPADEEPDQAVPFTVSSLAEEPTEIDPELLEVFLEEYEEVSEALQRFLPEWLGRLDDANALTEVRRCFHTLKGSGRMVGAFELGDFCWQIEGLLNALLDARIKTFPDAAVVVRLAQAALPPLKQRLMQQPSGLAATTIAAIGRHADCLASGKPCDWKALREELPSYLASMLPGASETAAGSTPVSDIASHVLAEALREDLAIIQALLEAASIDRSSRVTTDHARAAHAIAKALNSESEEPEARVATALGELFEALALKAIPFDGEALWVIGSALGQLHWCLDRLDGESGVEAPVEAAELVTQLLALTDSVRASKPAPEAATAETPATEEPQVDPVETADQLEPEAPQSTADSSVPQSEIVVIFMEEAREVLARCDNLLNTWRDDLAELDIVRNLQREIHTFKGGARMAGLMALGEFSHAMESLLERIAGRTLPASTSAVRVLEEGCDRLNGWLEDVSGGKLPDPSEALKSLEQKIESLSTASPQAPDGQQEEREEKPESAPEKIPEPTTLETPEPVTEQAARTEETTRLVEKGEDLTGQSYIRVDAELLDNLINSAGEINILRSRLERQVGNLRNNLGEFEETIGRLRDQFRKLEMETETQIRSRYHESPVDSSGEFDPLELDQFSSLQQHSRGLSEAVADLLNLQELLDDATHQSEALLTQQSRFGTELQEGLMKTRMVHFGSIAARLRRLVRSAARDTDKQARLHMQVVGTSDQLDRNVLERITAPLEHMLRNSIAHGIEEPAVRQAAGKEAEGRITITVESEATEFVIRIEDDGNGIDLNAIRERAVARGLLGEDERASPQRLLEFILQSGFSTSNTVTKLAGRGVGLDVVSNEIKQIGGSLEINTDEGQGTCFTIRIPFTLAVMQAIGVLAGEQRFLIPLASVAGVARLVPADYRQLIESDEPRYEFAGESYPVMELEALLGETVRPLGSDNVSLLVIRAGAHSAAFRVPQLLGHREIVIKPVGPQISSVPGILGGTVTGDGQVVVILDPGSLIRHALIHGTRPAAREPSTQTQPLRPLAMVVDDSITMRKITSRVLEHHDFEVITAKDGVDATEQMQERVPELLLLDIEMPRMDGYAVAEHVRADPRLRHIPIIMITSRSGEKHRARAERAGANAYLTKPYKESELLTQIRKQMGMEKNGHD